MSSLGQVANVNSDVVRVTINGKQYEFSQEHIKRYPKLLDPSTRYMLGFEALLNIIYEYPVSTIREDMLDEPSEKQQFLKNCERLDIKLSDDLILHLTSKLMKDIQECSDYIREQVGKKGKEKMRFVNKKKVIEFCVENENIFNEHKSDIKPIEVINLLELGTKKSLEKLVLADFRSNNVVKQFINKFLQFFLSKVL